jgi:hypothetical protein
MIIESNKDLVNSCLNIINKIIDQKLKWNYINEMISIEKK